ncbi:MULTISPECIES: hypothetical protein [Bacillus]|uniref:hypothetical protein n=1 Tax=Bacillus TaxID=1386 RepID=UPI001593A662|nr:MULTISPECIES: hypothetical protein [Bacillus]MEC1351654.1 hypothetical protein [Bacillus licheniformis]MEC1470505.1 hypothetical protein [Bacillus haynesii]MEC1479222.1 hypothetical protein [Bacillus haynesii]NVB36077.1 hypothetical protein [Bacillus licheniformis]
MIRRSRRRHLFISYTEGIGYAHATSRTVVALERKRRISPKDIERVEKQIEEEYGIDSAVITNYQYF